MVAWLTVLSIVAFLAGCDSDIKPIKKSERQQMVQQPVGLDSGMDDPLGSPPPKSDTPAAEPNPQPEPTPPPEEQPPEEEAAPKPSRPDDVAQWKKDDFVSAKQESDPRLTQAVAQWCANPANQTDRAAAAELLIAVLRVAEPKKPDPKTAASPSPPPTPAPSPAPASSPPPGGVSASSSASGFVVGGGELLQPGQGGPMEQPGSLEQPGQAVQPGRLDPPTIQLVVHTLAANGTPPAWQALRDVVTGKLKTDNDRTATQTVLRLLLAQPSLENETLLFQALTEPEKLRAGGSQPNVDANLGGLGGITGSEAGSGSPEALSADAIQQVTQSLLDSTASEAFRVKVANHLLTLPANHPLLTRLLQMVQQPKPENVGAQLVLYQSRVVPEPIKNGFEQQFTQQSSQALGYLLGVLAFESSATSSSNATPGESSPATSPAMEWGKPAGGASPNAPAGESTAAGQSSGGGSSNGGSRVGFATLGGPVAPSGVSSGAGASLGSGVSSPPPMLEPSPSSPEMMGGSGGGASTVAAIANPAMLAGVVKTLWSPTVTQPLGQRVSQVNDLRQPGGAVFFARSVPNDRMRNELRACFARRFDDGPDAALATAGSGAYDMTGEGRQDMLGETFVDPGLLVVVRSVERDKASPAARTRKKTPTAAPVGGAAPKNGELLTPGAVVPGSSVGPSTDTVDQWRKASLALARKICRQCEAAASHGAGQGSGGAAVLPIKLHPNAAVTTRFDLNWPGDASGTLNGFQVDPLQIHYVRIEGNVSPLKLLRYYERTMKKKHREIGSNEGAWYDSVQASATPGRKTTVDVLITRLPAGATPPPAAAPARQNEPTEPLVVEILAVEINDPGTGGA